MNSYVNLGGTGDYQTDVARLSRQQQLADQLQREALEPLQAPQGATAPISWTNVLAKALQGWGARRQSDKIDERYQQLGQQDRDASQALLAQLTKQTPAVPGPQTTVSGTLPSLPGQTAPQPQGPQVPMQTPTAPPQAALSPQEQMAAILGARGGPQTQMIQSAMLPQLMQRQNKEWEADQPMTRAAREQGAMQLQNQEQGALYQNKLGPTQEQVIQNRQKENELANERQKTNLMYGAGIGVDDPVVASHVQNILSGNEFMANVPARYKNAVSQAMAKMPDGAWSPRAKQQNTISAARITKPYTDMPLYQQTAGAQLYLDRINAARQHPGSVADQELLDSLTKLNTGGNAVTDAQVHIITGGKSFGDWLNVTGNKLKTGGVLSDDQRNQIVKIANSVADNYRSSFQPLYDRVSKQLTDAGVPKPFWTIPDLNAIAVDNSKTKLAVGGTSNEGANIAPAGTKATGPGGKVLTSDGKGGWN